MLRIRSKTAHHDLLADDDVLARLADCHVRIRRHCDEALALAAAADLGDSRACVSAAGVRDYFGRALLLHAEDEDASVLPHLSSQRELAQQLAEQHRRLEEMIAALLPSWDQLARAVTLDVQAVGRHRERVSEFVALMQAHLVLEETEFFPRIADLTPAIRTEIVHQMQARRRA